MCWFCTSVHGYENLSTYEESRTLKEYLRPKTKAEMIRKAKSTHSRRQQKIVGGIPVEQGESPWTVRYIIYSVGIQIRNMKMGFNIYGTWRRVTFEKTNDENLCFFYSAKAFSHPE